MTPLSNTSEYALRLMTALACWDGDAPPRASDLREEATVPSHYASKILRQLVSAGLLESRKGHGGGFVLTQPPSRISLFEILTAVGFENDEKRCAYGWATCNHSEPCPLHATYVELRQGFLQWARGTRLSSVCDQRRRRLQF